MQRTINNLEELEAFAKETLPTIQEYRKVVFEGNLGAGKTTLIKQFCSLLEVEDQVSSPTFSLINPYQSPQGVIYHLDLYRLEHQDEAFDIGVMELLDEPSSYVFVEWADLILDWFPETYLHIEITRSEDESRQILLKKMNNF